MYIGRAGNAISLSAAFWSTVLRLPGVRSVARTFGSVFVQGTRDVPGLQHTAHGGDGVAHGGACISNSGSALVGGGISEASALLFGA